MRINFILFISLFLLMSINVGAQDIKKESNLIQNYTQNDTAHNKTAQSDTTIQKVNNERSNPYKKGKSNKFKIKEKITNLFKNKDINNNSIWLDSIQKLEDNNKLLAHSIETLNDSIALYKSQAEEYKKQIVSLKEQIKDSSLQISKLSYLLTHESTIRNTEKFYCRAILEAPLYVPYNEDIIEHCLQMVKLMEYDKSKDKDIKYMYNTLYPLIVNYKEFSFQIAEYLKYTISEFDYSPNRLNEKEKFYERIKGSKYYEFRHKDGNAYKEIYFLEYLIEKRIRSFFENDKNFKKENFEKERKRLLGE